MGCPPCCNPSHCTPATPHPCHYNEAPQERWLTQRNTITCRALQGVSPRPRPFMPAWRTRQTSRAQTSDAINAASSVLQPVARERSHVAQQHENNAKEGPALPHIQQSCTTVRAAQPPGVSLRMATCTHANLETLVLPCGSTGAAGAGRRGALQGAHRVSPGGQPHRREHACMPAPTPQLLLRHREWPRRA